MNINDLANLARDHSKKSKAKMWPIVKAIIESSDDDNDLIDLYAYFKPTPSRRPKTPTEWVALAVGNKDVRYHLNSLYSDGKRLVATDGHRLHVYQTTEYEPGYYDTAMNKVEVDTKFPDIDRVIPALNGSTVRSHKSTLLLGDIALTDDGFETIALIHGQAQRPFITDALSYFDSDLSVDAYQKDENSAIRYTQGDLTAVVMPIRL